MKIDYKNLSIEQVAICDILRKYKLSAMAEILARQFANPNNEFRNFEERLKEAIDAEVQKREKNKLDRLIKNATLKYPDATLDEKLQRPERKIDLNLIDSLCECSWIPKARILSITGATGTGKSYLACALAVTAMMKGYSAKYIPTNILIAELQQASATNTIIEYVNAISGYDLLVLDDFGYSEEVNTKKKPMNYHRLFEVLNARENRKATIIAAQIPRSDWYDLFRNDTYADACMDRITKSNFLIELEGPSLR